MPGSSLADPRTLDDLLLYRLAQLLAAGGSMVIRLCEGRFGITRREWRILAAVAEEQGLLSSELADRAKLDRARTSRAISSLVQKGLLQRQTDRADRRQAHLAVSAQGQAVYDELSPLVRAINRDLLGSLATDDVDRLDRSLAKLQARAAAMAAHDEWPKADRRRGKRLRAAGA